MSRERRPRDPSRPRGVLWVIHQQGERSYEQFDEDELRDRVRRALADPHPVKVCVLPVGCELDVIDLDLLNAVQE